MGFCLPCFLSMLGCALFLTAFNSSFRMNIPISLGFFCLFFFCLFLWFSSPVSHPSCLQRLWQACRSSVPPSAVTVWAPEIMTPAPPPLSDTTSSLIAKVRARSSPPPCPAKGVHHPHQHLDLHFLSLNLSLIVGSGLLVIRFVIIDINPSTHGSDSFPTDTTCSFYLANDLNINQNSVACAACIHLTMYS